MPGGGSCWSVGCRYDYDCDCDDDNACFALLRFLASTWFDRTHKKTYCMLTTMVGIQCVN